jgi:NADH dehydrogenase
MPVRIVIVGGGIAGILLATKFGRQYSHSRSATVTLIDKSPTHVWKPMLHTIAAGTHDIQQQRVVLLAHARENGYRYVRGEMVGLDRSRRTVALGEMNGPDGKSMLVPRSMEYDVLVLALGSTANDFGVTGVAQHCHFIDSQREAEDFNLALRARAARSIDRDEALRIAVVGGGATGVELSAELSRLLEVASTYGHASLRQRLELTLCEAGARLLPTFPEYISAASQERLEEIGIRVRTSTAVKEATPEGFMNAEGNIIEADLMVWAAGVKAPDFMSSLAGLEANRANQIVLRSTLQSVADDHVFAIGDCASLTPTDHPRPLAPTAQVATQQAEHLGRHLPQWLKGSALPDFQFRDFGSLVTLSNYDAFGALGKLGLYRGGCIRGRLAQLGHTMVYRRHQMSVHGLGKAALLWSVEKMNSWVQPEIRLA